jgi:ABC-type spermidine/putrescine transport system permease subunit II
MGQRIFGVAVCVIAVTILAAEVLLPLPVARWSLMDARGAFTVASVGEVLSSSEARTMVVRSILLSVAVSTVATLLALFAALALLFRSRLRSMIVIVGLPLFMSGGQTALAQSQVVRLFDPLPAWVVLMCSLVSYALPFAVIALVIGSRHISRAVMDAGAELAGGRARSITSLVLPMMAPAICGAATVSFLVTINEGTRTFHLATDPLIATYIDGKMAGGGSALAYAIATVLYGIAAVAAGVLLTMRGRRAE